MSKSIRAQGFELQAAPRIYVTALPGRWLLEHSTPSWRLKRPRSGFQRIVREERARKIAIAVLGQRRTFPNAIILATDERSIPAKDGHLEFAAKSRFLVVDGQHRLWAQSFSDYEATYACMVHVGLSVVEMARLFLEINDNQKRVPSSLRWDLVRLVRPEDDEYLVEASELVYALATEEGSPLYQKVDLTGEVPQIPLKQGSLAPELRTLVSTRVAGLRDLDFERHYEMLVRYISAIKSIDPDGWRSGESPLYKARVLRALIRLLPLVVKDSGRAPSEISAPKFREYVGKISLESLSNEEIRAVQGSAGMKEIYEVVKGQVFN